MINPSKGGIIILEGPDAQGKTTISQTLKRLFAHEDPLYLHATYRWGQKMWTYQTALLRRAVEESNERLVILDRHWPSEITYGTVFRNLGVQDYIWEPMDLVFQKQGACYIMCLSNVEDSVERHAGTRDPNHPYDDTNYRRVWQSYSEVLAFMALRPDWLHYQIEVQGQDVNAFCRMARRRVESIRRAQHPTLLDLDYPNMIGSIATAKAVLVGEKRNPNKVHRRLEWPFYDNLDSSRYLFKSLKPLNPSNYILTNALVTDQDQHNHLLSSMAFGLPLITLGNTAAAHLKSLGLRPAAELPHPQWARRFDHHGTWGDQLKGVLKDVASIEL